MKIKKYSTPEETWTMSSKQKEWLKEIEYFAIELKNVPDKLLSKDFYLEAVKVNGHVLGYVPEALEDEIRRELNL